MLLELRLAAATSDVLSRAIAAIEELLDEAAAREDGSTTASELLAAVGWSYRKGKPLLDGLTQVLALESTERAALAQAVRDDRVYLDSYDDESFAFAYRGLRPETAEAGKGLLTTMYKACVERDDVEQQFREANPQVSVCPYCLIAPLTPSSGRAFVEIDHFLPQALYPHLCANPSNLVLTCQTCNGVKRARDPLVDQQQVLGLPGAYLPYRRAGLAELKLEFPISTPGAPVVALVGSTPAARVRARTLNRLIGLEDQWSQHLRTQHEVLMNALARKFGSEPDREAVRAALLEKADDANHAMVDEPIQRVDRDWAIWLAGAGLDTVLDEIRRRAAQEPATRT